MKTCFFSVTAILLTCAASALAQTTLPRASWRYYRVGNTGIQGDYCEAIWIAPDGNPYIAGYDPIFEEGGFSKFQHNENRWINFSNVDYPIIGHPDLTGVVRVMDIISDASGKLWMGTWRGGLSFNPAVGGSSIIRLTQANSGLIDERTTDIDLAPDGTLWFSNGGTARYNPATNSWTRWQFGNEFLSVQPKSTGGYLVWCSTRPPYQDYTFVYDSTTQQWTMIDVTYPNGGPGDVAGMPGTDCVDDVGNFWALRLRNPGDYDALDYRRPDGTWVSPPEPYYGVTFNIWAFKAYGNGRALLADGAGRVYQFNGASWSNLGVWRQGGYTYAVDIDAAGNVWVSGIGGAARRDVLTGVWQRYRVTNTSNFDNFNSDLTLGPAGTIYAGANAGSGVGGMVRFDGTRWTGWNQAHYGLGYDWPFPNDNCHALTFRPSNGRVAVSPLNWLYGVFEWTGSAFVQLPPLTGAEKMVEDSLGRLWALGEYFNLNVHNGTSWSSVPIIGWGQTIRKDPDRPGTVWALTGHEVLRTDGVYRFSRTIDDFPELTTQSDTFSGIAVGRNGIAWIGCTVQLGAGGSGGGLIRLDANTGSYTMLRYDLGWPMPGKYVAPHAVSPDGRVWMTYISTYQYFDGGLCWYDGRRVGVFPGPEGGAPQWGGLPHTQIADLEVRVVPGGYELWMICLSRGIAVLSVGQPITVPATRWP